MEKSGYIYVLTNESFHRDNWIKIGYAEDVDKRVKELSGTAVPLPYEVYCTYEIPRIHGVKDPDKLLHDLITKLNPGLRISPNREFFEMLPWDAYDMLFAIAQMHDRTDKLKRNDANLSGQEDANDSEYSVDTLFPSNSEVRSLYDRLKFLNGILNINRPGFLKLLRKYLYRSYRAYAAKVKQKRSRGEWIETWGMIVDPEKTEVGFAFTLVGCPLAEYAKK